jgi:hypothetical protein
MADGFWASPADFADFSELSQRTGSVERMSFGAGAAVIERLGENVVRVELSGKVGTELANSFLSAVAREVRKLDRFQMFLDLEQLDEYHSSLRRRAVEFLLREPEKLIAVHGFARSKMVNMALAVANLALGGKLVTHDDRLGYEIALRDAVHGITSAPEEAAFGY